MFKMSPFGMNMSTLLAISQLHHQSLASPSCPWSHTHVAKWQTKWRNPPDLGLVSSVATCLPLWNQSGAL